MCGICGFVTKKDIPQRILTAMCDNIRHRGPDDAGEYMTDYLGNSIGLGHRRLSILDVSSAGHQPMFTAEGKVAIVYNGEVYNFREIRESLQIKGYRFQSDCDTEVILAAYMEHGIQCVEALNGMFAFALVDFRTGDMFFIRDRMGQKPLYLYQDGESIVFASELKAILQFPGVNKEIRTDLLGRYLFHGYFDGEDTVFRHIKRVLPGHIVHLKVGNIWNLEDFVYWNIPSLWNELHSGSVVPDKKYEEYKEELKELLRASVRRRMVADVPIGLFLSGGIDSSLISAVAQECSTKPIKTYCIGFSEKEYDESRYAKEIAAHLGTEHHTLDITDAHYNEMLNDMCWYFDEPFADESQIPTMLVSKFARQDVTVVLSGDAGDELFCGYTQYDLLAQIEGHAAIFDTIASLHFPTRWIGNLLDIGSRWGVCRQHRGIQLLLRPLSTVQLVSDYDQWFSHQFLQDNQKTIIFKELPIPNTTLQIKRMLLDTITYLPDDILVKVDRASMRFSLECRSPFLDPEVVKFALQLPQKFKYQLRGQQKKVILCDILSDYVPRALYERPKHGFGMPVKKYLENSDFLKAVVEPHRLKKQGIFQEERIQDLYRSFLAGSDRCTTYLWHYFVFQLWYARFVEDLTA